MQWFHDDKGIEYRPERVQVRFRGLFSPIPQVVIHGPFLETDVLEAILVADTEQMEEHEKALDGKSNLIYLFFNPIMVCSLYRFSVSLTHFTSF